jgi:hypothetical protein
MEARTVDKSKYEWGRKYAQFIMENHQSDSICVLVELVDDYKFMAYEFGSAFTLGIADEMWQWVLERDYEQVAS